MGKKIFLLVVLLVVLLIDIIFFFNLNSMSEINNIFHFARSYIALLFWIALTVYLYDRNQIISLSLLTPIFLRFLTGIFTQVVLNNNNTHVIINRLVILNSIYAILLILILTINYIYKRSPLIIVLIGYYVSILFINIVNIFNIIYINSIYQILLNIIQNILLIILLSINTKKYKELKSEELL